MRVHRSVQELHGNTPTNSVNAGTETGNLDRRLESAGHKMQYAKLEYKTLNAIVMVKMFDL